jgi:hypothetical protein
MARDDVFRVRHQTPSAIAEASADQAIMNRMGSLVVTDFVAQMMLSGNAYHIQIGALSTPVAGTAALTALIAVGIVTNPAGYALVPLAAEIHIATYTTGTLYNSMIELDMAKNRYTSGGTAVTPRNLRGDSPHSFNGQAFNNTGTLVIAAASAAPHSVELSRRAHSEDNIGTSTGADAPFKWDARSAPGACLIDVASVVLHHGSATATDTVYGLFDFAQFDKALVV